MSNQSISLSAKHLNDFVAKHQKRAIGCLLALIAHNDKRLNQSEEVYNGSLILKVEFCGLKTRYFVWCTDVISDSKTGNNPSMLFCYMSMRTIKRKINAYNKLRDAMLVS